MPIRTYCVLGGAGFLGRSLLARLAVRDGVRIKVLTMPGERLETGRHDIETVVGDLTDPTFDPGFFTEADVVINLVYAAPLGPEGNLEVTRRVAEKCLEAGVARLVHCSTAVVAGDAPDDVITEELPCRPVDSYEKTKLAIEDCLFEMLSGRLQTIMLRPTAVVGPGGHNLRKLASEILNEGTTTRMIKSSLNGSRQMNLVAVRNVGAALAWLAAYPGKLPHDKYIISDDDDAANNYADIAALLTGALGRHRTPQFRPPFQRALLATLLRLRGRSGCNPSRTYSADRIRGLGFKKVVSLKEEILSFADWYRALLEEGKQRA